MKEIKQLCRYERLMLIQHSIDSELGKHEMQMSVQRIIEYIGKRQLSKSLKCEKEEVEFVLTQIINSL